MTETVRLGVIVPSVNIVVEGWYPRAVPEGVSVHFARMLIADGSSPEKIIAMDREDGMRAIGQIASCRPHAVAYGCTASSIVQGHAFDERLRGEIRHIAGAPTTTATDSIFAACRALGLKKVTAISPYTEAVDTAEHQFFAEGGIETVAGAHLGITDGFASPNPNPRRSWSWRSAPGTRNPTGWSPHASISALIRLSRRLRRGPESRSSPRPRECCGTCCGLPASRPRSTATAGCCVSIRKPWQSEVCRTARIGAPFRCWPRDGGIEITPHPRDPDPSALLGNIPASVSHPARIARPMIRRGWLERGPGTR